MALNRGLMLSHHSQKVLSGRLGWVHVMAGLFCQARESNPGLRCRSVMFYHCSTERCWTQMRGTTKVTKNSPLFPRATTKELSIQIPTKRVLERKTVPKNKVLRRAKNTLSRRQMLPTINGKNYNRTQRNKILKNLQRSQRHKHSSIIQQE